MLIAEFMNKHGTVVRAICSAVGTAATADFPENALHAAAVEICSVFHSKMLGEGLLSTQN